MKLPISIDTGSIMHGLKRSAAGLRGAVEEGAYRWAEDHVAAVGADAGEPITNHYRGEVLVAAPLHAALTAFEDFAEEALPRWRKTAAIVRENSASTRFTLNVTMQVRLQPRSFFGTVAENLKRSQPKRRYDRGIERVPYRYDVNFDFRQEAYGTRISYRTVETIDPECSCGRNLDHFEVPRMPRQVGDVGERALAALRHMCR
ncbi:MAG TPA: hypothetical protein VGH49_10525 [Xanthobacteraceae bacterium]